METWGHCGYIFAVYIDATWRLSKFDRESCKWLCPRRLSLRYGSMMINVQSVRFPSSTSSWWPSLVQKPFLETAEFLTNLFITVYISLNFLVPSCSVHFIANASVLAHVDMLQVARRPSMSVASGLQWRFLLPSHVVSTWFSREIDDKRHQPCICPVRFFRFPQKNLPPQQEAQQKKNV